MKILSIAQDVIYGVANSKKLTPKHVGLGLVLQATSSENLVNLFHAANHTTGTDSVRRLDNLIASTILEEYVRDGYVHIPSNIMQGPFTQFSCNNTDVLETMLDGKKYISLYSDDGLAETRRWW